MEATATAIKQRHTEVDDADTANSDCGINHVPRYGTRSALCYLWKGKLFMTPSDAVIIVIANLSSNRYCLS